MDKKNNKDEKTLADIEYNEKLARALAEKKSFFANNGIVVLGPDGSKINKMRFYAYGGCIGYIPTTQKTAQTFTTLNPDYYTDLDDSSSVKCVAGLRYDAFMDTFDNNCLENYLEFAVKCAKRRWDVGNENDANKERDTETRLVNAMMGRKKEVGCIVIDMEFDMPVKRIKANGEPKHASKPDMVVFNGKSFGFVELKYNGCSMESSSENSLSEHFEDFNNVIVTSSDKTKWAQIEKCLRRMKYLMAAGLVDSSWEDNWNVIFQKYQQGKTGKFDESLLWCGFIFIDSTMGLKEEYVKDQVEKQLKTLVSNNPKCITKYEYGTLENVKFNFEQNISTVWEKSR